LQLEKVESAPGVVAVITDKDIPGENNGAFSFGPLSEYHHQHIIVIIIM